MEEEKADLEKIREEQYGLIDCKKDIAAVAEVVSTLITRVAAIDKMLVEIAKSLGEEGVKVATEQKNYPPEERDG